MPKDYKELSKIAFNEVASTYDYSSKYQAIRDKYDVIVKEILKYNFSNYLDIGCGTGTLLNMVKQKKHNVNLFGYDLSKEMIKIAQEKLPKGSNLLVGDSIKLPYKMFPARSSFHSLPTYLSTPRLAS
jgi:ubiquinone/menaquinone biosynthesis C-methylase UbiE